jgi:phosphoribosyl 1,2-cyclic phosphate phosphodiesterase
MPSFEFVRIAALLAQSDYVKVQRLFFNMRDGALTITFLGTGTSTGVPLIRCACKVCQSKDPRDQRLRSSIYVQASDRSWIVDTGAEFRIQALREKIQNIDAVLYTHSHADHIMGFDDLRRYSANGEPIPIYASEETMQNLKKCFSYAFSGEARFPGYVLPEPHLIQGPFLLGETEIHPIRLEHGSAHVFGFLFRRNRRSIAAYLSDCKTVYSDGLKTLEGIETLILGTPCRRIHPTHMSMAEGLALARRLNPSRTFFTHLSHDFSHAATQKELPDNIFLAYDGLRLEL